MADNFIGSVELGRSLSKLVADIRGLLKEDSVADDCCLLPDELKRELPLKKLTEGGVTLVNMSNDFLGISM